MPALPIADQDLLHKLLLGQLSTAEVERLATEYADDGRLAELAESVAGKDDALLDLLQNHETAVVDPEGERLVERLLERLRPALPVKPRDDTAAMNKADASTEPSSPDLTGKAPPLPERLEHYRPIKVLGQGGMGTVYLAEDTRLGREVAIKTLRAEVAINPQFKQRFLREARTAAKLEHDHIIPIYSVGEAADGTPFLAMPLLKGEPLDALIRRTGGPLPVAMVVRLAREAASGLGAAHARGLIHRDIKPANIWLEAPTGRVKILDFGLAKAADAGGETESDTHLTASGAIVGTPAYMAPEQASGHTVDGRADLFSLGCVLYELLAGKRAFSGPNTMSILMSLANHTPTAPDKLSSQCPAALSRLVMQLLEKDPTHRPASAEAVIRLLDNLDVEPATVHLQASRAASAPGISPDATAVRGLTPSGSPTPAKTSEVLKTSEVSSHDLPRPSDSSLTLPATEVLPVRKRAIPKQRVAHGLAGVLLMLLAAVVYRIQTDQGTLVVTIDDPAVQAILERDGLVIRDKNSDRTWTIKATERQKLLPSGKYEIDGKQNLILLVTDDSGAEVTTDEFTLKRKGERRVRVMLDQAPSVAEKVAAKSTTSDPDRSAAEWVLLIGGKVTIKENDQERPVMVVGDLPGGAFELTVVNLEFNPKVSDAGLAHFKNCKNLLVLNLYRTQVSDEGLAHFKNCSNLTRLNLAFTPVSDAGLFHFKNCKNFVYLDLGATPVSDLGLTHFKDCKNLTELLLSNTKVSDTGLAHFKNCTSLVKVELETTLVSDAGLSHFADCPKLGSVNVKNTKVTEAGVKKLSAALPGCKIEWDGGVIEPTVSPDRRAAEYVLSIGGRVDINGSIEGRINAVADLPLEPFRLTQIWLQQNAKVTDAGLAVFQGCKNLEYLSLYGTSVSDAGLANFQGYQNLRFLDLSYCAKLTDAGLKHFKECKNLVDLRLTHTSIGDEGLANFQGCANLTALLIAETQATDAGLAYFKDCPKLLQLQLSGKGITDAGLAHFQNRRDLSHLHIQKCDRVTDAGLAHFQDCKKLTELQLIGLPISDLGVASFQGCPNLVQLWLAGCPQITDAGVAHFKDCRQLFDLNLQSTRVTDAGLAHFAGCTNLQGLNLIATKITNEGLAHFATCTKLREVSLDSNPQLSAAALVHFRASSEIVNFDLDHWDIRNEDLVLFREWKLLTTLSLGDTKVTDAGLDHLKECKNLTLLLLQGSKVTAAGVNNLKQALPLCRIEWDGGVIEPNSNSQPK